MRRNLFIFFGLEFIVGYFSPILMDRFILLKVKFRMKLAKLSKWKK